MPAIVSSKHVLKYGRDGVHQLLLMVMHDRVKKGDYAIWEYFSSNELNTNLPPKFPHDPAASEMAYDIYSSLIPDASGRKYDEIDLDELTSNTLMYLEYKIDHSRHL